MIYSTDGAMNGTTSPLSAAVSSVLASSKQKSNKDILAEQEKATAAARATADETQKAVDAGADQYKASLDRIMQMANQARTSNLVDLQTDTVMNVMPGGGQAGAIAQRKKLGGMASSLGINV